ncbi:glutamate--cysteine ligase [Inhella inkyongensis]|uniref:Glutamate--cysteine ligase n=1 Tax=Inhella inkyongensis TaxID=392593 RepID=A0A840S5B5_9BURK|nr:glutamate--cysteine ligase [Inhella inkyongensis]MBB5205585.1 glutamate--cysteine ligase [Inhella inkyongensis]
MNLSPERLQGIRRGVEKESLRVLAGNGLALTPHPLALGSALTHPHITTDFSESQLELVTGVHARAEGVVRELTELHQFVYRAIGEERLWVGSMPCGLPTDETIPIGRYGTSNIGRAKSVYRMGLGHRYGRRMQTISGIHYNWSLPGLSSDDYFALIRNFRRHSFLLLTLFGASPAVCSSFVEGREHGLQSLSAEHPHTLQLPYATSLRMGRLGYQSDAQSSLAVSYNCLESYAGSLQGALTKPYGPYERIGVRNLGGEYNQLATSLLQIENEFYGTIRPKRVIRPGERPLHALRERGVEYIEVRCMDLDPFEDVGIAASTMKFLDVFLLHCLTSDSPPDSPEEIAALARNQQRTASRGREPGLKLERAGSEVALMDWAAEILEACEPLARQLDAALGESGHREALAQARERLAQPDRLPSARVLAGLHAQGGYTRFTRAQGESIRNRILALPLDAAVQARLLREAADSIAEQERIEAADTLGFEDFRQRYLAAETLGEPEQGLDRGCPERQSH